MLKFKHFCIPPKVKTNDEKLKSRKESQAVNTLTAHAYTSKPDSKNYLHIGLPDKELKIEDNIPVTMNIDTDSTHINHDITYMVCSLTYIWSK